MVDKRRSSDPHDHQWVWVNEYNDLPGIKQYRMCMACGVRYHELVLETEEAA